MYVRTMSGQRNAVSMPQTHHMPANLTGRVDSFQDLQLRRVVSGV